MPADLPTVRWISATLPKAGNRPEENEDAIGAAPKRLHFAIADGASEAWESGPWAKRLVENYVRRPPKPDDFSDWLDRIRDEWSPTKADGPVAWYAAEKQTQGSFATLAGLEIRSAATNPGKWHWKALAIGDSCLIHIRDQEIEAAFPHASRAEFSNRPPLVPSSPEARCPPPQWLAGHAAPEDRLLLATDAVAAHLLDPATRTPSLAAINESLHELDQAPLFGWLREVQLAMNDDVSVIAIRIPGAPEVP